MTYKVQGIILRKHDHRDADRRFVLYTFQRGKIEAIAKGARKSESKLSGDLELLNHAIFTIGKGRMLDRIATVDIVAAFHGIKDHASRLTTALYCFEIFDQLVKWEERDEHLFLLLIDFLETLHTIERRASLHILANLFLLKFFSILGSYEEDARLARIHGKVMRGPLSDCIEGISEKMFIPAVTNIVQKNLDVLPKSKEYFDFLINTKGEVAVPGLAK